ncbi:DUF2786 domain-containing protein [uncultured Deefgea sp.]|uniref:DUF2786 domain-containing protein n=1 Tax=uncultured Deefgea sp. TaxID=1304914 RepID=UPI0026133146|nr:DUF2786 domain-containing protein [uncultured Deefgea sp.]
MSEAIIEKCRKLLAMSNQDASPEEAATAASMLRKLMDKHQLDESMLEGKDAPIFGFKIDGQLYRSMPKWMPSLAIEVAKYNDCIVEWGYTQGCKQLRFKGYAEDCEIAMAMFEYLRNQIQHLCKLYCGSEGVSGNDRKKTNAFMAGACQVIRNRLAAMMQERKTAESSTALVVIKSAAVEEEFGPARYQKVQHAVNDAGSLAAGRVAGASVSIHKEVQ